MTEYKERLFKRLLTQVVVKAKYTNGILYIRPVDIHSFVNLLRNSSFENCPEATRIILFLKEDFNNNFIEFHYENN